MLVIKQTADNSNVIDVFTGKGWTNWSRFEVSMQQGKFRLKLIKGVPMIREEFRQLLEQLNK